MSERANPGVRSMIDTTVKTIRALVGIVVIGSATASAYQGGLAVFSFMAGKPSPSEPRPGTKLSLLVVIPAHNEETSIGECLDAIAKFETDETPPRIVVVADNCTDDTAGVAERGGAEVLVREDPEQRGKGEALAWAFDQPDLLKGVDVVFLLDADDRPERHAIHAALAEMERTGADIVQVAHISRGVDDSTSSAIDFWATTLYNRVRPRGLSVLGLSTRLQGGGMLFEADVIRRLGWPTGGVSEDMFASLVFLDEGYHIGFTDDAMVWALSEETEQARRSQRLRWESGRLLASREIPSLIQTSVKRRSCDHAVMATHLLVPPLTVHVALLGLQLIASWHRPRWRRVVLGSGAATAIYLAEGLRLMGRRDLVYSALADSLRFGGWKLRVQAEVLRKFRTAKWETADSRSAVDDS